MKVASKLIHGGPVHPCHELVDALQECMVLSECILDRWFYLHGYTLIQVAKAEAVNNVF